MRSLLTLVILLFSNFTFSQTNIFPPTGDAEVKAGKLLLETNTWRESLLTFKDTHYAPAQVYKFQLESDGLKLWQNAIVNYQFKSGGDFIVNNGNVGIGTYQPDYKLHIKDGNGGAQLKFQRGSGTSTILQDNNANNLYIEANSGLLLNSLGGGNVGIGTTTPDYKLHIKDGNGGAQLKFQRGTGIATILQDNNVNNLYLEAASGLLINSISGGRVGIGTQSPAGKLHINTNNWLASLLTFSDTHYSPAQVYHFQIESDGLKIKQDNTINFLFRSGGDFIVSNGAVHSKEVKVSLTPGTGPDYVFEPTYNLSPLDSIKTYIDKNKHLPEVPSAKEMEQNGVNLGEMNMLLLKKIEELTLYVIEQNKRIDGQQTEIKELKNQLNK